MSEVVRPWKVWSADRQLKKSVTACSLQELIEKGCSKLGLSPTPQPRVVLEEDGTEVDEDEYLSLLPTNTAFLFLQNNQRWRYPEWIAPGARHETSASNAASVETDASNAASVETDASNAASVETGASNAASVETDTSNAASVEKDDFNDLIARMQAALEDTTWEQTKRMAYQDFALMEKSIRETRRLTSRHRKHVSASRRATLAVPRRSRK